MVSCRHALYIAGFVFALCTLSAHAWRVEKDAILLQDVDALVFRANRQTEARRLAPEPQLRCKDNPDPHHSTALCARYAPSTVLCKNSGMDDHGEVQWRCEAELHRSVRFGTMLNVLCEGYKSAEDPRVLAGSCLLEYNLEPSPAPDNNNTATYTVNIPLVFEAVGWIAVLAILGVIAVVVSSRTIQASQEPPLVYPPQSSRPPPKVVATPTFAAHQTPSPPTASSSIIHTRDLPSISYTAHHTKHGAQPHTLPVHTLPSRPAPRPAPIPPSVPVASPFSYGAPFAPLPPPSPPVLVPDYLLYPQTPLFDFPVCEPRILPIVLQSASPVSEPAPARAVNPVPAKSQSTDTTTKSGYAGTKKR